MWWIIGGFVVVFGLFLLYCISAYGGGGYDPKDYEHYDKHPVDFDDD